MACLVRLDIRFVCLPHTLNEPAYNGIHYLLLIRWKKMSAIIIFEIDLVLYWFMHSMSLTFSMVVR